MDRQLDNVLRAAKDLASLTWDGIEWTYNYLRIGFHDWVDQSGHTESQGMKCIYYTFQGQKYLVPIPHTRGPAKKYPELERYFNQDEKTMVQFMGPDNDWHGQGEEMMRLLKLC